MSVSTPIPPVDRRYTEIRHLDLPCAFTAPKTRARWEKRVQELRARILVSAGLSPMPDKSPLNTHIFDRIEHKDYTIEKVYFESLPGFFVTGNLYRPVGVSGKCPGILNPHGHWRVGRLVDEPDGSVQARGVSFARQGCVAFTYDMIGYNDSKQIDHRAFNGARERLWGLSIMGLQLWNSIRSVDFLISLPDVDPKRIACTGASGGGTQSFMLTAVDNRIMLSAPVNMISGHMQGGCLCENAPGLRVDTNNIEIGAMMAPRPMIMVSATGDWTVHTPGFEYPAIRDVYRLYSAEDRLSSVQIDAGHNYNRDSRNAVYAWFGKMLFGGDDARRFTERSYTAETPERLLVFADEPVPDHALDASGLFDQYVALSEKQFRTLTPRDEKEFRKFRKNMGPGFQAAVKASAPDFDEVVATPLSITKGKDYVSRPFYLGRKNVGDRIPARLFEPAGDRRGAVLLTHPDGCAGATAEDGRSPGSLAEALLKKGWTVLAIDAFMTGSLSGDFRTDRYAYFDTYNSTPVAHRVQDILTAVTWLRKYASLSTVSLIGQGDAGLWSLLACALDPHILRVALDMNQFNHEDDQQYIDRLYIPCFRRVGDIRTAFALAAPAAMLLHNAGPGFPGEWITDIYRLTHARDRLRISRRPTSILQMVKWAVEGPGI